MPRHQFTATGRAENDRRGIARRPRIGSARRTRRRSPGYRSLVSLFVVLPLVVVFAQALSKGIGAYLARDDRP